MGRAIRASLEGPLGESVPDVVYSRGVEMGAHPSLARASDSCTDRPVRANSLQRLIGEMMKRLLVVLTTAICWTWWPARAIEEGKPAPPLEAKLLDGAKFALAGQGGKVVVINFWATWCTPCREEMPALEAFYQRHRADGLEILAISMDEPKDEATVREVMRGFTFPAAMVRDASAKGYGRIWRIPLTFVIDRRGILRKDGWYGDPGIDLPLLDKTVLPLLADPSR